MMMDLLKMAAQAFIGRVDEGSLDIEAVTGALGSLLGSGERKLDVAGLVAKLGNSGLGAVAGSWLGDGANASISPSQVQSLFSSEQISAFSGALGIEQTQALEGLSAALPKLVDQASGAGSLLEGVTGGAGGLGGLARGLLGR